MIGNGAFKSSSNFGTSSSDVTLPTVANTGHGYDAFISTLDSTLSYNVVGNRLYELDRVGLSKTDITSSLTLSNPAGMDAYPDGSVYVISATGALNQSLNSGGSFSSYSTTSTLTSCSSRILKSHPSDRDNVIATACNGSSRVAYTLDGGSNWKEINLNSYSYTNSCTIRDIAVLGNLANKKIYIACENLAAIYLEMD